MDTVSNITMDLSATPLNGITIYVRQATTLYRYYLDKATPYTFSRWGGFAVLITIFFLRIIVSQRWFIVCYTLAIYLLNMFLAFLQPRFDPSLEQDLLDQNIEEGSSLPTENDEEFRPFIRRLPEFKFWFNATRATLIALLCSFFSVLDIPAFWPILLVYFIILFSLTMRKQIQHMIKYRYIPFNLGKAKYGKRLN